MKKFPSPNKPPIESIDAHVHRMPQRQVLRSVIQPLLAGGLSRGEILEICDEEVVLGAMALTGGNLCQAARMVGCHRNTFSRARDQVLERHERFAPDRVRIQKARGEQAVRRRRLRSRQVPRG